MPTQKNNLPQGKLKASSYLPISPKLGGMSMGSSLKKKKPKTKNRKVKFWLSRHFA
jgi:hypothetical protein